MSHINFVCFRVISDEVLEARGEWDPKKMKKFILKDYDQSISDLVETKGDSVKVLPVIVVNAQGEISGEHIWTKFSFRL